MSETIWAIFPWLIIAIFVLLVRIFLSPKRCYTNGFYVPEGNARIIDSGVGVLLFLSIIVAAAICVLINYGIQ